MSIKWWADKQNGIYPCNGLPFSPKNEWSTDTWYKRDQLQRHVIKRIQTQDAAYNVIHLYESSKIDGANTFQQYTKITLPYMLFVTGPYLLTNFIGNINNFNVIYLLTTNGGTVSDPKLQVGGISASPVDLLVTWLFNITMNAEQQYKLASVIGIMIFVVVAVISLIVYNVMPSTKNEEDYA